VNHNRIGLTALLVVVVGLGSPSQPAHAVPSVPPASVFTSDRDGDSELYYRARTGRVVQLTRNTADDFGAVHAPDGRRLAFASDRDGDDEIFTMEITGRHIRQLTDNTGARDNAPAWSPDGTRIAFSRAVADEEQPEIWVMDADGGNQVQLTFTEFSVFDTEPSWSPDGQYIAFTSSRTGDFNVEIFVMRADGSDVRRLTTTEDGVFDGGPDWSPDGRRIVFHSNRAWPMDSQDLYVMDADGGNVQPLAAHPNGLDDVFPRWTADGTQVFFTTFAGASGRPREDIWVVDADGTDRLNLSRDPAADFLVDPRPES